MTPTEMADDYSSSGLPIKPIPGSYGLPFLSPIRDRFDFYYFQGRDAFFQSRVLKYQSTVFRVHVPPGPFMASDPRVVAVLDAKSFPVLFDLSIVDKTDVLTGTYIPSADLTGGFRPLAYLDPADPRHAALKHLVFDLLAASGPRLIPSFCAAYSALLDSLEVALADSGPADFNTLNEATALNFVCDFLFGGAAPPPATAHKKAIKWLFFQLHPLLTVGLPKLLEDLFLHCFPFPPFLVRSDYKAPASYFAEAAKPVLDEAEKTMGLSREETLHNLVFVAIFNAYGGIKLCFPGILRRLAEAGPELHARLAREIRSVVRSEGGAVTAAGLERMELTKSVVWEFLRLDPPVEYQYARAKKDLVIESHEAAFRVKKGELIFGYQPLATRDEKVFRRGGEFVGDRFVGEGRKLLKYVYWSNGRETDEAEVGNKQCPGKDVVVMVCRLLLIQIFLRYNSFITKVEFLPLEPKVTLSSFTNASSPHRYIPPDHHKAASP